MKMNDQQFGQTLLDLMRQVQIPILASADGVEIVARVQSLASGAAVIKPAEVKAPD